MGRKRALVAPSPRDLRLAVGHLIELASAYEKNGVGHRDDAALAPLIRCVALLRAHRERLGAVRQRVATAALADRVAVVYRRYQAEAGMSEETYRALLNRCLRRFSWPLPDRPFALTLLVATRAQIRNNRGPKECAAQRVGEVFDVDERTIFNRKRERGSLRSWILPPPDKDGKITLAHVREVPVPTAFGTTISPAGLLSYARAALSERNVPPPELRRKVIGRARSHAPTPA